MPNIQLDIDSENFDKYFQIEVASMTQSQKECLPPEILYKINSKKHPETSLLTKLFVLTKARNKKVTILIEDEVNGIDEDEYLKLKKLTKKHNYSEANAQELIVNGSFVLGNKELLDSFHRLNGLSNSSAYRYLVSSKNKKKYSTQEWLTAQTYLVRFLANYEAIRKKMVMQTFFTMPEWLVLIHFYHGNFAPPGPTWKEFYKYSFNASGTKIRLAFGSLQRRGYLEKVGATSNTKIRITALGRDKVNEIFQKYILNC